MADTTPATNTTIPIHAAAADLKAPQSPTTAEVVPTPVTPNFAANVKSLVAGLPEHQQIFRLEQFEHRELVPWLWSHLDGQLKETTPETMSMENARLETIMFPLDVADPLERIKKHMKSLEATAYDTSSSAMDKLNFSRELYPNTTPISSTLHPQPPSPTGPTAIATTVFRVHLPYTLTNAGGSLHGGATATIFDVLTSLAIGPVAKHGFWRTAGVSRTLNVTYLKPVPIGAEGRDAFVVCEIVNLSKRMAVLRGLLRAVDDGAEGGMGAVLATCEHGKVAVEIPGL